MSTVIIFSTGLCFGELWFDHGGQLETVTALSVHLKTKLYAINGVLSGNL